MADDSNTWIALSGWAAWAAKEIISALLKRKLARAGTFDAIPIRAGIFCDSDSVNSGVVPVRYFEGMEKYPQYGDCRRCRAEIDCQLTNDSDTQVVYTTPDIELWGVEGVRLQILKPSMLQRDERSDSYYAVDSIIVPPHGVTLIRFTLPIANDLPKTIQQIQNTFGEAVALLKVKDTSGKERQFRIATSSFAGYASVVWPMHCKYPIYNITALNAGGRRNAGKKPQARTNTVAGTSQPSAGSE